VLEGIVSRAPGNISLRTAWADLARFLEAGLPVPRVAGVGALATRDW